MYSYEYPNNYWIIYYISLIIHIHLFIDAYCIVNIVNCLTCLHEYFALVVLYLKNFEKWIQRMKDLNLDLYNRKL